MFRPDKATRSCAGAGAETLENVIRTVAGGDCAKSKANPVTGTQPAVPSSTVMEAEAFVAGCPVSYTHLTLPTKRIV